MENKEIPWINNPEDILGIGLKNLLTYRCDDPAFHLAVEKLNQKVTFDFEDLYPVSVNFCKPTIEILPTKDTSGLGLKMSMNTLIDIMKGRSTWVGAFLRGKLKISRWWKILSIIRLLKVLLPALYKATERAKEYAK